MKKKFVFTLSLLVLLASTNAYSFDWLKSLESKKTKSPAMRMLKSYDMSHFSIKEKKMVREAVIKFMVQLEKDTKNEKIKTSSIDFDLIEQFILSTANAGMEDGGICYFGGWRSVVIFENCASPTNISQTAQDNATWKAFETAYSAAKTEHNCTGNNFLCNPSVFGPGICVSSESTGLTERCSAESNRLMEAAVASASDADKESKRAQFYGSIGALDTSETTYNDTVNELISFCEKEPDYDACKPLQDRLAQARASAVVTRTDEQLTDVDAQIERLNGLKTAEPAPSAEEIARIDEQIAKLNQSKTDLTSLRETAVAIRTNPNEPPGDFDVDEFVEVDEEFKEANSAVTAAAALTVNSDNTTNATNKEIIAANAGNEDFDASTYGDVTSNVNDINGVAAKPPAPASGNNDINGVAAKPPAPASGNNDLPQGGDPDLNRQSQAAADNTIPPAPDGSFACQGAETQELPSMDAVPTDWKPGFMVAKEEFPEEMQSQNEEQELGGTQPFLDCQEYTHRKWKDVVNSRPDYEKGGHYAKAWIQLFDETGQSIAGAIDQYKEAWNAFHANIADSGDSSNTNTRTNSIRKSRRDMENALRSMNTAYSTAKRKARSLKKKLKTCAASASMMKTMDFDDADLTVEGEAQSMDGTINCKTKGAETQDFAGCKSAVTMYNAAMIANQGLEIYEQVDFADFQMDQQMKLQENTMAGAEGDFTFALKSQKASIEKHAKQLEARAVFDGVKMGVFFAGLKNIPTKKEKQNECIQGSDCEMKFFSYQYNEFITYFMLSIKNELGVAPETTYPDSPTVLNQATKISATGEIMTGQFEDMYKIEEVPSVPEGTDAPNTGEFFSRSATGESGLPVYFNREQIDTNTQGDDDSGLRRVCAEAVGGDPGMAIIENGEARDAMKAALLQSTADLATHLLQKNILDKQAQRIQDAINGIQNFEPIPLTFTGEDLVDTLCAPDAFPEHPSCLNLDTARVYGFPDQSFNINGADASETGRGLLGDNVEDNNSSDAIGNSDPDNRLNNRNRTVSTGRAGGNGGLRAGGGSGSLAGGSALGSASGGSAAPGGGTPSGGGAKNAGGKNNATGKKRKIGGYDGSSAGSLAFGRGGTTSKKKTTKNPFANFKKKNDKGGVLSFRNPAGIGSKTSNIFKMISSGYTRAVKRNALLNYKEVKK